MKNLLQPRWVCGAYWVVVVGTTLLLHPTTTLDATAIWTIVLFVLAFSVGVIVATAGGVGQAADGVFRSRRPVRPGVLVVASVVGAVANLVAALLAVRSSGRTIDSVLSIQGLASSANALAVDRYSQQGGSDLSVAFLLGLGYAAALVAPFVLLADKRVRFRALIVMAPMVTSLAYASVSSARLGFLVASALTAGGVIASTICKSRRAPLLRLKAVVIVGSSAVVIAILFIGIGALRVGRFDSQAISLSTEKQVIYIAGPAGAYATWLHTYNGSDPLGLGTATIAGMEYITGKSRAETRAFDDFAVIDTVGRTANVYTAFRGLITDFGISGGVILLAVVGFGFGRMARRAANGSAAAAAMVGFGYATVFLSGWLAITTFTNVAVTILVVPLILKFAQRDMLRSSERHSSIVSQGVTKNR